MRPPRAEQAAADPDCGLDDTPDRLFWARTGAEPRQLYPRHLVDLGPRFDPVPRLACSPFVACAPCGIIERECLTRSCHLVHVRQVIERLAQSQGTEAIYTG